MRQNIMMGVVVTLAFLTSCQQEKGYDATGTFEATQVTLSAEATGHIVRLEAEEGYAVKSGQEIGLIDTMALSLQKELLRQQQSAILVAKPDIDKQVRSIRNQITKQERELARLRRMEEGGAATAKQVDDVATQLTVLRSQLDATLQQLAASTAGIDGNAAAMEIQMRIIDNQLEKCHIIAPADGTVLVRYAQQGEMAVAGKPLMKVADLDKIYLRAYFTSDQLANVKLGQEVTVIADFGGDEQIRYTGRVEWIASESEFTPKSIQTRDSRANLVYAVKIAVKNDGRLKIGMYGEVIL